VFGSVKSLATLVLSEDYSPLYKDRNKNQVVVTFIGHRKNVYDDFTKML
jgi:hypothetical protein